MAITTISETLNGIPVQAMPTGLTSPIVAQEFLDNLTIFYQVFNDPNEPAPLTAVIQSGQMRAALLNLIDLAENGRTLSVDPNDPLNPNIPQERYYLTSSMIDDLNQLLQSLKVAGVTDLVGFGDLDASALLRWKALSQISDYVRQILQKAQESATDRNRSIQALIELEYVKTGNEVLGETLSDLEESLALTKDALTTLRDLQELHNKIDVSSKVDFETLFDFTQETSPSNYQEAYNAVASAYFGVPIIPSVLGLPPAGGFASEQLQAIVDRVQAGSAFEDVVRDIIDTEFGQTADAIAFTEARDDFSLGLQKGPFNFNQVLQLIVDFVDFTSEYPNFNTIRGTGQEITRQELIDNVNQTDFFALPQTAQGFTSDIGGVQFKYGTETDGDTGVSPIFSGSTLEVVIKAMFSTSATNELTFAAGIGVDVGTIFGPLSSEQRNLLDALKNTFSPETGNPYLLDMLTLIMEGDPDADPPIPGIGSGGFASILNNGGSVLSSEAVDGLNEIFRKFLIGPTGIQAENDLFALQDTVETLAGVGTGGPVVDAAIDIAEDLIRLRERIEGHIAQLELVTDQNDENTLLFQLRRVLNDLSGEYIDENGDIAFGAFSDIDGNMVTREMIDDDPSGVVTGVIKWLIDNHDKFGTEDATKAGDIQRNITFATTAAESLNDSQKEDVRRFLFLFEEYYKSASAILTKISQLLEKFAQGIAR